MKYFEIFKKKTFCDANEEEQIEQISSQRIHCLL